MKPELVEVRPKSRPEVLAFVDVKDTGRASAAIKALLACGYPALSVRAFIASDDPRVECLEPHDGLQQVLDDAANESIEYVLWMDGRALPRPDCVERLVEALLGDESLAGAGPGASGAKRGRPRKVASLPAIGLYRAAAIRARPALLEAADHERLVALAWVEVSWSP